MTQPTLYDLIPAAKTGDVSVGIHVQMWWYPGSVHMSSARAPKYSQQDPAFVKQHVAYFKSLGIDYIFVDGYPTQVTSWTIQQLYAAECEAQGMGFVAGIDAGAYRSNVVPPQVLILSILKALGPQLVRQTYLRVNGKPLVPYFSKSPDTRDMFAAIEKLYPELEFAYNDSAMADPVSGNTYGWIKQGVEVDQAAYISKHQGKPGTHIVPLSWGFDDSKDWPSVGIKSSWKNPDGTYADARKWGGRDLATFQKFCEQLNFALGLRSGLPNGFKLAQIIGANDFEEGTAIEAQYDGKQFVPGTGLLAPIPVPVKVVVPAVPAAPKVTSGEIWLEPGIKLRDLDAGDTLTVVRHYSDGNMTKTAVKV